MSSRASIWVNAAVLLLAAAWQCDALAAASNAPAAGGRCRPLPAHPACGGARLWRAAGNRFAHCLVLMEQLRQAGRGPRRARGG